MLLILLLIETAVSLDVYVDPYYQDNDIPEDLANTYGWFVEALLGLKIKEETTIYLAAGTHYIQTNYDEDPYLLGEPKCAKEYTQQLGEEGGKQDDAMYRRRNPLRYMGQDDVWELADATYGATFKITVKTMRCSEVSIDRCVNTDDPRAILSWANPYVTFEVLDEFTLEDVELTGYESLGKGCQWENCTWCQPWTVLDASYCDQPAEQAGEHCDDSWPRDETDPQGGSCVDICNGSGLYYSGEIDFSVGGRDTNALCCSCGVPDGGEEDDYYCDDEQGIMRCDQPDGCEDWCPPDETPTTCPACCTLTMLYNDRWESECNFEACNYGNYYRCFPINPNYLTDCQKLHNTSLFRIGDRAYISDTDEANFTGAPSDHRTDSDTELFWDAFEFGIGDIIQHDPRWILDCGSYPDLLTNGKGRLTIRNAKITYFQQEYFSLFHFFDRTYTDDFDTKRYICHPDTGLELENVDFDHIRTVGPIIYSPIDQTADDLLYGASVSLHLGLQGKLILTNVSFKEINTSVPYINTTELNQMLPGIMYIYDFGFIEMTNVSVEKAAFFPYQLDDDDDEDFTYSSDWGTPFYFNYVQELKIDGLNISQLNLRTKLFVLMNLTRSINWNDRESKEFFANIPCKRVQYPYYLNCDLEDCNDDERDEFDKTYSGTCWQGEDIFYPPGDEDGEGIDRRLEKIPENERRLGELGEGKLDVFDYCWAVPDEQVWVINDNGINPIIVNNFVITDVYWAAWDMDNGKEASSMIEIKPEERHSAHYNYNFQNWRMERIHDFSENGQLVELTSGGEGSEKDPLKLVINPPGLLIENWNIDTVFSTTILDLKPSVPTRIVNLTIKNHLYYDGSLQANYDAAMALSPISMIYPLYVLLGGTVAGYTNTVNPDTTLYIQYEDRDAYETLDDDLKPADSFELTSSTFESWQVWTSVVLVDEDVSSFYTASTLTFKECACVTNNTCDLYSQTIIEESWNDCSTTFRTFSFIDCENFSADSTTTSIINFQSENQDYSDLLLDDWTLSGNLDFKHGLLCGQVRYITIQNCTFTNNSMKFGTINFLSHQDVTQLLISNSDFTENVSIEHNVIYISSATWLSLQISGGEIKRNASSVIGLEAISELDSGSTIQNVEFADNSDDAQASDIFLSIYYGKLTITNCQFSGSKAPLGSSIVLDGDTVGLKYPDSIDELVVDNQQNWPELHIISCTFEKFPTADSAIIVATSLTYSVIYSENLIVKDNNIPLATTNHMGYIDNGSHISYNNATQIFKVETKSDLKCTGTTFEYNTITNGVVEAQLARIWIELATFQHNLSTKSSGALFFYKINNATMVDTIFVNNTAAQYGSIMFASQQEVDEVVPIEFRHCTFERNHADTLAGMQLTFARMKISQGSNFFSNTAAAYPGIYLFYSTADIVDSKFHDQLSVEAAFIRSIYSDVNITNSNFTDASGNVAAMMKISDESNMIVKDSRFLNSESGNGAIHVELNSYVQFIDTIITYMHSSTGCSFTCIDRSRVDVYGCTLSHSNLTMITASTETYLDIWDSDFYNSTATDRFGRGGFLSIIESNFNIIDVMFNKSFAGSGGAIYYASETEPNENLQKIVNSRFYNNRATEAGALYLADDITSAFNCTFVNNEAIGDGDRTQGDGGALFYHCKENCKFQINQTKFENNIAAGAGGSISWDTNPPHVDDTSNFINNSARYGDDTSSPPTQISYLSSIATDTTTNRYGNTRRLATNQAALESVLTGAASGQDNGINLTFGILDDYGQIVISDDVYTATVVAGDGTTILGTLQKESVEGLFTFDDIIVVNEPGTNASVAIVTDAISDNLGVTSNSVIDFQFYVRECEIGEELSDNSCLVWNSTFTKYTFEAAADECTDCPSEAICLGGAEVFPKEGYWRSGWNSSNFYECPIDIACLGGNKTKDYEGKCDDDLGYEGRLCTVCMDDYTRLGKYECSKCPDKAENALILVGLLFAVMGLIAFVTRSNLMAAEQKKKEIIGVYVKIMTNYFQIITLVNSFKLDWPQFVLDYYESQGQVGAASDRIFSFDCWLSEFGGVVFYSNLIIVVMLPVVIMIMSTLIWSIIGGLTGTFKKCIRVKNYACILVAFFLIHPNLIKTIFVCFSCVKIDDELYLDVDMSQECWTGDHWIYSMLVALPALIVWGIGLPAVAILILMRQYNRDNLNSVTTKSIFGFLYNGYRYPKYYWEIVILYRKVLLVFVLVFLSLVSIDVQALVALFVMVGALVFHSKEQPFDALRLNKLETKSIIAASITIYCGLYYLSGAISEYIKIIFFIIIIAVNIHFFITWLVIFLDEFQTKIRTQNADLFTKVCGKCMSEHKVLKVRDTPGPPPKHTALADMHLEREAFLLKEFSGDFAYSEKITKKQFTEMVKDKGLLLYEVLKDAEWKDPSFYRSAWSRKETEIMSPTYHNEYDSF